MYKFSKDYGLLYERLLQGHQGIGRVMTGDFYDGDIVSITRFAPFSIHIGQRGMSHGSIFPFHGEDGYSEETAFINTCEYCKLEWINPDDQG